eukprot:gb/GECG01015253.1/.p1 GENE.gb/GECG01015253.1/~~gb/GECG01015253.1/.p1  ORF type:complete len:1476 (+),score=206.82 gb/GECG01015253.1/:1-4428(+)
MDSINEVGNEDAGSDFEPMSTEAAQYEGIYAESDDAFSPRSAEYDGEDDNERYQSSEEALTEIYETIEQQDGAETGSLDPVLGAHLGEALLFLAKYGTVGDLETGFYFAGSAHHCDWAIQRVAGSVLSELSSRLDELGMIKVFLTVLMQCRSAAVHIDTQTALIEPLLTLAHRDPKSRLWLEGFILVLSIIEDVPSDELPTRRIMEVVTPRLKSSNEDDSAYATYILKRLSDLDPNFLLRTKHMTTSNQAIVTSSFLNNSDVEDLSDLPAKVSDRYSFISLTAQDSSSQAQVHEEEGNTDDDETPPAAIYSFSNSASQTETIQTNAVPKTSDISIHGSSVEGEHYFPGLFPKRIARVLTDLCNFLNSNCNDKDFLCKEILDEDTVERSIVALEEILSILYAPSPPPTSEVAAAVPWTVEICCGLLKCTSSFKIPFLSLQVVEGLAKLNPAGFRRTVRVLVESLFRRLGDTKIVFRQANLKTCGVLAPLMGVDFVSLVQSAINTRNKIARESCGKLMTLLVLKRCPDKYFIVDQQSTLLKTVVPLFEDANSKVAASGTDFVAAFHQVLWLLSEEYAQQRTDDHIFIPPSREHTAGFMEVFQQVLGINRSSEMSKVMFRRLSDHSTPVPSISQKGFLELVPPPEMHKRTLEEWDNLGWGEPQNLDFSSPYSFESSQEKQTHRYTPGDDGTTRRQLYRDGEFIPPSLSLESQSNFNEQQYLDSPVSSAAAKPRLDTNGSEEYNNNSSFDADSVGYGPAKYGRSSPKPIHIGEQEHLQQDHYERILFGDDFRGTHRHQSDAESAEHSHEGVRSRAGSGFTAESSPPQSPNNTHSDIVRRGSTKEDSSSPSKSYHEAPSPSTPLWLQDDQTGTAPRSASSWSISSAKQAESLSSVSSSQTDETSKAAAMRARLTTIKRRSHTQSRARRVNSATARSQGIFGEGAANAQKPDFISPIAEPQAPESSGIYAKARFRSAGAGRFGRHNGSNSGWVNNENAQASDQAPPATSSTPSSKEYSRRPKGLSEYGGRDHQAYARAVQRANASKRFTQVDTSPVQYGTSESENIPEAPPPELSVVSAVNSGRNSMVGDREDPTPTRESSSNVPLGNRRQSQLRQKMQAKARSSTSRLNNPSDGDSAPPASSLSPNHETPGFTGSEQMYIPTEDLTPCKDPLATLERVRADVGKSLEWESQFNMLNSIRRLAVYHTDAISPCIHEFVAFMMSAVDNLRSSVAKNALMAFSDCFMGLQKSMDPELDVVVPVLLRKCADTAGFISAEAENALKSMCVYCGPQKSLTALLAAAEHKNASIRAKASTWLERWTDIHSAPVSNSTSTRLDSLKGRHTDRLLSIGAKFVQAGNEDARHSAKRMLLRLNEHGLIQSSSIDRVVERRRDAEAVHRLFQKGMSDVVAQSPGNLTPSRRGFQQSSEAGGVASNGNAGAGRPRREKSATRSRSKPPHPDRSRTSVRQQEHQMDPLNGYSFS